MEKEMDSISYEKSIPVIGEYDVVVVGSGPAGISAAVAASRLQQRVALIERYGVVGGNLTCGHVGPILGMVSRGTIRDEIVTLLGVPENDMIGEIGVAHDVEKAKRVLSQLLEREGVSVFLQTSLVDVIKEGNKVKGVVVSTKKGPGALMGKVTVDATGDGDVSYLSGCRVEKGREDGLMQPVTLEYTISGLDDDKAIVCIGDVDNVKFKDMAFLDYCKKCALNGELPETLSAVRLHRTTRKGERQVNTTQLNRIDSTRTSDIFKAEVQLREQMITVSDFLRTHLPGYENCYISSSGTTMGVRESRRVMGKYVLTVDDVASGRRFDDVVVHKAEFVVDIHNPDGAGQAEDKIQYSKPYDIPYRCFVPLTVDSLLVAGRCISGTHKAHASYRVMSICMAMGQAVGTAAAISASTGVEPDKLDYRDIQKSLEEQGVDLFSE